mgnify:CR=1 FL=1
MTAPLDLLQRAGAKSDPEGGQQCGTKCDCVHWPSPRMISYASLSALINARDGPRGSAAIDLCDIGISAPAMNAPGPIAQEQRRARVGLLCGLVAYAAWGVLPVYFKALANVSPVMIVAHRIVWSLLVLAALLVLDPDVVPAWAASNGASSVS